MDLHFRWMSSCALLPAEVRRAAESRLTTLWAVLPASRIAGVTSADFRLTLEHWTVQYAIDLDSHTVVLREARVG